VEEEFTFQWWGGVEEEEAYSEVRRRKQEIRGKPNWLHLLGYYID